MPPFVLIRGGSNFLFALNPRVEKEPNFRTVLGSEDFFYLGNSPFASSRVFLCWDKKIQK